ncbi:class I SAM-dependent methyltransferase [Arenibacter sp. S6351L]|uniref:class I SAM-dependent methyltransferase n=1 Tax=Arenibacter sp. S6351L TaxID=2926407 RepID=UPI001FF3E65D|nr:class I SAM-dependent methyltransferase [Arenibacter sp. S6351L]MCK0134889.1 class I SAM-dependent methyltransferase [Arenibacter sp. S6351L]
MSEFWETNFIGKQAMWGFEPAKSAVITKEIFIKQSVKNVLVPGIGYGRNAQIFIENDINVTGIEISKTAIALAKKHYGNGMTIYHGSVSAMPFDEKKYDGIFCHALIHLLNKNERIKLIQDCYHQLGKNGYMVFTAISKDAPNFGKGKMISKDRYEVHEGAKIYYYDREAVHAEFDQAGLIEIVEVKEDQSMFLIKCKKN